jgi:deazaflavin-dependent oxidoreductase (nitroreductase family)
MNFLTPVAVLVGRQKWLPRFLPQIVWLDRTIHRLTRGRFTLLSIAGLPELYLTVRGRKSGIPRTTPLLYVPHDGRYLIAGSNWGQPTLPVWVLNLTAAMEADVQIHGQRRHVTVRQVEGEERERLWQVMLRMWPNYAHYAERTDRVIPVFELSPV